MMGKEQHVVGSSGSPYTEACLCLTANSREERSQALGGEGGGCSLASWAFKMLLLALTRFCCP